MSDDLEKWVNVQTGLAKLYVHDFKNPISAISANLSYLEAVLHEADEDVVGAVHDSTVALKMLLHMVDNYLNISRLESREPIESVPLPLDRFIEEAMNRIGKMFTSPEPLLAVTGQIPSEMCFWPVAYARLAVENLLLQALHNTPASGRVMFSVGVDAGVVEFVVMDSGVVIDPGFYAHTFSREFQMEAKSHEHARYGRALAMYAIGLSSEVMGGSVRVESKNGQQQFVLRLPVEVELQ
ncbi:MAG: HAMP domain-containing histidine kinase [Deltaproteobacteria bacterium]|nr:HAMP domain-containing histidine kinase [Deltaproteobacteria bacterium]